MIVRKPKSRGLRTALACGASLAAIALTPTAYGQSDIREESTVYLLRYAQEIAEGSMVISQSKDMMMARERVGDHSMLVFDTQNGAITIERGGRTAVFPLVSKRGPETSYTFDYANNMAFGSSVAAPNFNVTVRPLVASSPELGVDARWNVETTLRSLLVTTAADANVKLSLSRTYLENDGKPVVLLEFEIPAFTYVAIDGSTIVHWARGMAVTDPGFAEIHALATQHRASVHEADGDMRPISIRTTMHGIDRAGGWRMSFANAPQIQAAMARVIETQGNSLHLTSATDSSTDLSVLVASRLNAVAFGVAENSANGIQLAIGASELAENIGLPLGTGPTQSGTSSTSETIARAVNAALGSVSDSNDRAREQAAMPFSAALTGVVDQGTVDAYNRNAAELASQKGYTATPPKTAQEIQQILDTMRATGQTTLNLGLSREAGAKNFMQLSDEDWESVMNGTYVSPGFDREDSSLVTAQVMAELQRRDELLAAAGEDKSTETIARAVNAALGSVSDSNDRAREQAAMPFSAALTGVVDQGTVDAYNRNAAELASQKGYAATPPKTAQEIQQILDTMRATGQTTLNLGLSREAGAKNFMQLSDEDWESVMNGTYVSPGFDPEDSSLATAQVIAELQRRKDIMKDMMEGRSTDDSIAAQIINNLVKYITEREMTAAELDALVSQMAREAMLEPRLQQEGLGGFADLPLWIDPNSPDADEYRKLVAELQREMEETRNALKGKKDEPKDKPGKDSGFGQNEAFYANNAFTYTSMVGVVATDLSRWAEWLATQNVRELERLALAAGYPNLASALADAQNILRQSQDPGYRQWALQAPSCAGPGGCGPSYLERWHMKTSIVALGDILADSRDIFSTGGFSDIGISGLDLSYLLRDHALEDGDIVRIRISQFGKVIYEGTVNLTNAGQVFGMLLGKGVASLEIYAVNEGSASPNTAQITVDKVVRGQATQTYSLRTGETATLRIESGAKPGAAAPSGAPQ